MVWRALAFLLLQALGGLLGWHLAAWPGALVAVVVAGILWQLLDLWRAFIVMRWLRLGECQESPLRVGVWAELADRMRLKIRKLRQERSVSDARLNDFLSAIQASPNGVVLLDPDGRIEWSNETASDHLGFEARRDLGQLIGNLLRSPVFTAYYTAHDYSHEVTLAGRGGSLARPRTISLQLHPYGDGRKLLLSRDVTALEQADAMRRDFVANVSHEIRTPLTVLAGFVETLQTLPLDEAERERYLAMMALQSQRMQSLVADLLTLSRLEGSPQPRLNDWSSLPELVAHCYQEAQALSENLCGGQAHQMALASPPEVEVSGVASELQSAVSNLLSNAVRYTPPGGSIRTQWQWLDESTGRRLMFTVADSGPGIEAEHLPRLTERFYRVDRSRSRETGGTGLGLAIVKHVLQRHGAELRISSKVGQGSQFSIVLAEGRVRRLPTSESV